MMIANFNMHMIAFVVLTYITTTLSLPINGHQGYPNMYHPSSPPNYYQDPQPPSISYPSPPANYPSPSTLPPSVTWDQFSDCLNKICQDDLDECIPQCMEPTKPKDKEKEGDDSNNHTDDSP